MRIALAIGAALIALALLPAAAQAKNCGRVPLGEGSATTAGTVITRNLSCQLGISILDRWAVRADKVCNRGICPVLRVKGYRCTQSRTKPTGRCVKGRRVARVEFGL